MFFHSIRFKVYKLAVGRQPFLFQIRSCFKIIPRQIETYVEADWSPYLLEMIILFLNKFKTASK